MQVMPTVLAGIPPGLCLRQWLRGLYCLDVNVCIRLLNPVEGGR